MFLSLRQIRLPVTAIASILHRLSGLLLFLALPLFIYALQQSLQGQENFIALTRLLDSFWLKTIIAVLIWGLLHHLFAGIRFLLLDIDVGIQVQQARKTALLVNILALFLATGISWGCL